MSWLATVPMVVAFFGALNLFFSRQHRHPRLLHRAKIDLEILALLPDASLIRTKLLSQIEATLDQVLSVDMKARRDPTGIALGAIFLCATGGLIFEAVDSGGNWWWLLLPAVLIGILGLVGLVESAQKKVRDVTNQAVSAAAVQDSEYLADIRDHCRALRRIGSSATSADKDEDWWSNSGGAEAIDALAKLGPVIKAKWPDLEVIITEVASLYAQASDFAAPPLGGRNPLEQQRAELAEKLAERANDATIMVHSLRAVMD